MTDKQKTGISGLDSLFYGGIHLEQTTNDGGLLVLARGEHGVNKVHLAMQMCEGLHVSLGGEIVANPCNDKNEKKIVFISLNKNKERLRNTYIGFYIQRLIQDVRIQKLTKKEFSIKMNKLGWKCEKIDEGVADRREGELILDDDIDRIINGAIFYDERTHGLHVKSAIMNPSLLYSLDMDKAETKLNVVFIGRKNSELYSEEMKEDTVILFNNMLKSLAEMRDKGVEDDVDKLENEIKRLEHKKRELKKKIEITDIEEDITNEEKELKKIDDKLDDKRAEIDGKKYNCIMIDGLSRLTEEEIARCRFSDLTDILRKISRVGIITADEKLQPTGVAVDIVIDMVIREEHNPECLQYALKISKCLYQKHVYGWHSYKMRRMGIEVIPSLHFQMNSRFHMDDAAYDSTLSIKEIPYIYFVDEYNEATSDEEVSEKYYSKSCEDNKKTKYDLVNKGVLYAINVDRLDDGQYLINKLNGLCDTNPVVIKYKGIKDINIEKHVLFIDLSRNRKEFYDNYKKVITEGKFKEKFSIDRMHLFNYRPGHIHDDDFLYSIEKQVQAIVRHALRINTLDELDVKSDDFIKKYYRLVHVVIGDINYINFAYPCLNKDNLLLPAISNFTKKYHMTNFIYTSASWEISILEKEKDLYQQLKVVSKMLY